MSLPQRPLSNIDLDKYAAKFKIPHFRGIYMRDSLPARGPSNYESAIINLDDSSGPGTHWVAYMKNKLKVIYYDSFGNLPPPIELVRYLLSGTHASNNIEYTYDRQQEFGTVWCGHLCLKFLSEFKNDVSNTRN